MSAILIEPDGKLMVLVIADTNTLMIYEGTTLRWSAQLPFTPVAVTRAHFQVINCIMPIFVFLLDAAPQNIIQYSAI